MYWEKTYQQKGQSSVTNSLTEEGVGSVRGARKGRFLGDSTEKGAKTQLLKPGFRVDH